MTFDPVDFDPPLAVGAEIDVIEDCLVDVPIQSPVRDLHRHKRTLTQIRRFIWPVRGSVISRFGSRRLSGWHSGVDIKAPPGTPIRAAAPGTVTFSGRQSSYGRTIKIAHANGLSTVYAHNSANFVKAGDPVKAGTPIGTVGRTGRAGHPAAR